MPAVRQKLLDLNELVRLTSAGPAKLFGLERKGLLAPGYDADIVLVDQRELAVTLFTPAAPVREPTPGLPVGGGQARVVDCP